MKPAAPLAPPIALLLLVGIASAVQARTTPRTSATSIPVYRPVVVNRLPHDPSAFTEGFELAGGVLYEGTGLEGQSGVRRVAPDTGKPMQTREPPVAGVFGEGVSVLNGQLFELTWQSGLAFVYDAATLKETGRFRYDGEGWGLTNDGTQLIMSDGSDTLRWRDPLTFTIKKSVNVTAQGMPVTNLNELEYAGGWVWANIWLTTKIARIDPKTGKVTAWLDISELSREAASDTLKAGRTPTFDDVPNGVAYNKARGTLLLTGKRWPTVFEVRVPGLTAGQ
ncbi:glutaminyl-peptide cyclotransferase [Deinococcus sp. KNUC1210]|uniref:glutaminyl-peptide cyclotransferase n=1 Tax=Deinococcus sp. KNUC1210 TaxID=2917691 RepID=UPI001EEFEA6D|nr:glutaminyl-peptide cyclotransferase [Deinococcus sp. KNUC1210]ULH16485.1 glutaminyl-peptide cyclotransferase [Deinococcus sp. KNUC1210]